MQNIFMISNENNTTKLTFDNGETKYLNILPLKLLQHLCIINGSSLDGRVKSFKYLTTSRVKPCIMIKESAIYMPTMSSSNQECEYVLYNRIVWIRKEGYKSLVLFDNGYKLIVNCSYKVLRKQLKRCDLFKDKLMHENFLKPNDFI